MISGPFVEWHSISPNSGPSETQPSAGFAHAQSRSISHSNLHFHGVQCWLVEICSEVCLFVCFCGTLLSKEIGYPYWDLASCPGLA